MGENYPVKKRREPRRLNPNQEGIRWLERTEVMDLCAEISSVPDDTHGLVYWATNGSRTKSYSRPMFQLIFDWSGPRPGHKASPGLRCPGCADFSRSWACDVHGEVDWDWDLRTFCRSGYQQALYLGETRRADLPAAGAPEAAQPVADVYRDDTGGIHLRTSVPADAQERVLDVYQDAINSLLSEACRSSFEWVLTDDDITVEGTSDEGSFSYRHQR
jgi:hypothetical protein